MKNLAIIGASYFQLPLIQKAKEMGFCTHVFAWKVGDIGEFAADHFYPISITELDKITEKCREIDVCGICSIATDLGNYTVNYVADKLGLAGNSMECTRRTTNKFLMRKTLQENGDPIPKYMVVNCVDDILALDIEYPVIVKPTDRSGSRGVYLLENGANLQLCIDRAISESFEKKALIEEYVSGKEFSIEGISYKGDHNILAITEKTTTGAPYFIEKCQREPAKLDQKQYKKISKCVIHALDSLGIKNSASHSEVKIDVDGNIKIIEIGSRMGGDCIGSDLVRYSIGIDFTKAVIQVACGEKPDLEPKGDICDAEVRFIITESDAEEFERIKNQESSRILRVVDEVRYSLIGKTTDSSNRAGCYIVKLD